MFNNNLLMGAASAGGTSLVEVGNSALFTGQRLIYRLQTAHQRPQQNGLLVYGFIVAVITQQVQTKF